MVNSKTLRTASKKLLKKTNFPFLGKRLSGKVRDIYITNDKRILVTTDRISAFDRVLGYIPYKGQVLNLLSAFWFVETKSIVPNHLLSVPHPNVSIVKDAKPYSVEMVIRGYISGVTKTSLWKAYESGERVIYGIKFPDGLRKNQMLDKPVITPTTKAEKGAHDEKLTRDKILKEKIIPKDVYLQMEKVSLQLFEKGRQICQKRGLILVDTKYEFAEYHGKLLLIDEIHTPDSSRFWKGENYEDRFERGLEPENFDKEFFRIWYVQKGYNGDGEPPDMSVDLQIKTASRYIKIYEMITNKKFKPMKYPLEKSIVKALAESKL
ncbi:phosphoribosylaminoimidazolesuccinocarboxamide synthase [Candidatus Gottesmanbacteria bacterium]|nr:phosphoribosylaminoimidazolesuccinocarboxamide synthase [Candidatus Gottesmanbacteria bacterium]